MYLIFIADELLCKDPNNRLGNLSGVMDVVNHPWCKKIKLSDVMNRNIEPASKPNPFIMYFE